MRISTKVSLSLILLAVVIFGGLGTAQVVAEKRDLEEAFLREASTLCRATAESIRQDLAERDPEDSTALLHSLERFDRELDVMLWRDQQIRFPHERTSADHGALIESAGREAVTSGDVVTHIADQLTGGRVAVVASPIDPSRKLGAVVLVHSLDALDEDLRTEAVMTALGVLLFSGLAGALGFVLGKVYIVRPLARLDHAMRSVASGDLAGPSLSGRGDEVGQVLRHFDVTRLELARARERLEAEQEAHRATLDKLARADRLATVGQLAAGLAHEIGSPLQILHGRAQKMASRSEPGSELAKTASIIVTQTERITGIVRQLLQFARPRPAQRRLVDLLECLTPVAELLELDAGRRGVSVRLDAPGGSSVMVDPDALQQIVFNLARNGLAAVSEGGTVEIRVCLDVTTPDAPTMLRLTVSDDGPGMPADMHEQIFEPFFTTRPESGGIGLGLTVVRSLVEGLRGTIKAVPGQEKGTQFTVRIPC